MAPPRASAIVICSCGSRWGNADRAALHEDMLAVEHALLETYVPKMVRHWQLGHRIRLGENAPREFLATIAKAAAKRAGADEGNSDPPTPRAMLGPADDG